jgi:hypothetical protein|tara:strand:- start:3 stop:479 length:477 start_codon:yes stop_codon:yes gene_type:complete
MANDIHIISGKAHWASVLSPNTKYEPHKYCIDVELNEDTKQQAENLGLIVKNKGSFDFITIKRNLLKKNGDERPAPFVKDSSNNPWDNQLIGNGSDVNVKFATYDYNFAGKAGVGTDLMAVQVVNLIKYGNDEDFDTVDNGYVISGSSSGSQEEAIPF